MIDGGSVRYEVAGPAPYPWNVYPSASGGERNVRNQFNCLQPRPKRTATPFVLASKGENARFHAREPGFDFWGCG